MIKINFFIARIIVICECKMSQKYDNVQIFDCANIVQFIFAELRMCKYCAKIRLIGLQ